MFLLILTRVQTVSKILAHHRKIYPQIGKLKKDEKTYLQRKSTLYWYVFQLSDASAVRDKNILNCLIMLKNSSWKLNLTPSKKNNNKKPSTKDDSISRNFLVCIFLWFERTSLYSEKVSNDVCGSSGMVFRENDTNHVTYCSNQLPEFLRNKFFCS